jgi:hypothetical protein
MCGLHSKNTSAPPYQLPTFTCTAAAIAVFILTSVRLGTDPPRGENLFHNVCRSNPRKNSAAPLVDLNPAIDPREPVVGLLGCCCSAEPRHVRPLLIGSSAETTHHHCHSPPTAMTVGGKQLLELRSALGGGGTREDFLLSILPPAAHQPAFKRTSSIPARSCCCFWDEVVASAYS